MNAAGTHSHCYKRSKHPKRSYAFTFSICCTSTMGTSRERFWRSVESDCRMNSPRFQKRCNCHPFCPVSLAIFEGVVAKRLHSIYLPGATSDAWQKQKTQRSDDFLVGGYVPGRHGIEELVIGRETKQRVVVCRIYQEKMNASDFDQLSDTEKYTSSSGQNAVNLRTKMRIITMPPPSLCGSHRCASLTRARPNRAPKRRSRLDQQRVHRRGLPRHAGRQESRNRRPRH
jgi:hypothetical protein